MNAFSTSNKTNNTVSLCPGTFIYEFINKLIVAQLIKKFLIFYAIQSLRSNTGPYN